MTLKYKGGLQENVYSAELNNIAYANQNGILTGCVVSETSTPAMTVDITSGNIFFGNDTIAVTAVTSSTISNNTTGFKRIDLIAVNSVGTISIIEGTAALIQTTPEYDPDDYIILARVTVEPSETTILDADIKDIRVLNQGGSSGGASGSFGRFVEEFTAQTSVTVTHNLGDDEPIVQVYNGSNEIIIPSSITIVDTNSLTVTFSTSTSGKIIIHGGSGLNNGLYTTSLTAETTATITHNLSNMYPNVVCYDSSEEMVVPQSVTAVDEDSLTIVFNSSFTGTVMVSGGIALNGLANNVDVDITSVSDNDLLAYNSSTEKWENTTINAIGANNVILKHSLYNTITALQDRATTFSSDGGTWAEAYVDTTGQLDSVDTDEDKTTALFDTDSYKTPIVASPYVIVEATSLSGVWSSNNCLSKLIDTGKWIVYCTTGTDEVKRAQIYKSLYYGTDGTDSLILDFATVTAVKTSIYRDVGKQAHFAGLINGGTGAITNAGTFINTATNTDCSIWSRVSAVSTPGNADFEVPTATTINTATNTQTFDELGTDKTADEGNNFATVNLYTSSINDTVRAIILCVGDITWAGSGTNIDFFTDHSIPLMTDGSSDTTTSIITHDLPSGSYSSTISSCFGSPKYSDYEDGVDTQYKLTNTTEDTGWLNTNEVSTFTAFTAEPDTCIVKLIPKTTSPTSGYPSINGFGIDEI